MKEETKTIINLSIIFILFWLVGFLIGLGKKNYVYQDCEGIQYECDYIQTWYSEVGKQEFCVIIKQI